MIEEEVTFIKFVKKKFEINKRTQAEDNKCIIVYTQLPYFEQILL